MKRRWIVLLILSLLLLAACGGEETPEAAPTAVAVGATTVAPTDVPVAEEPTAVPPTETPLPTETAVPATPTPFPTATVEPTVTATQVPTPANLLAAEDFTDHINPFTGEYLDDNTNLLRRPIAVKISNSPPEWVRPQSGIGQADLVFEHVTEGPITRFTALFYSQTPEKIGPIRSARLIDVELP
ncbi:MAG: DUF3048 domain-containing protein, partial [Anaerolineales bacterium]|nr:DUF3048 domain-containing protein [Anaerolineales bacterium]